MHVCIRKYINIPCSLCIFINIQIQLVQSIYRLRYVFRAYLALENELLCSSPGKTTAPVLSIPWLPVVLCLRLRLCKPVPLAWLLVVSLFSSCLGSRFAEASWSLVSLGHTVSQQVFCSSGSSNLPTSSSTTRPDP